MKWFNDLATTGKLFVWFGLLAVLMGVVGFTGLSAAGDANTSVDVAYNRDMKGVDLALRADIKRLKIAKDYRQGLLAQDDAGRQAALRELDEEDRALTELLNEIRPTLVLQENIARLEAAKKISVEYSRLANDAVRTSGTDRERAMVIQRQALPIGVQLEDEMDAIVGAKKQLAKREQDLSAERYARSRAIVLASTLLAILFAVGCAIIGGRAISNPLKGAVGVLERMAAGDLSVRLDLDRKDEVGQMAAALNRSLEAMQTTLAGVQDVSIDVSSAASQLASSAESISSGAQEQAASLEETAASLEEISSTVKQNADNARQAAQLANGARDAAERGGQVVESAVSAMTEITKSSKKIADIITTIDEIAFQTNLLALNAAVEAARAGEQGRGFGVVAAEVRALAQRTASAAKEIRVLIADSSSKVEVGTQQVNRSGETLGEIVRSIKRVTDMVSEIAAASREQNSGVDQVNTAVTQVDQVTQGNAAQTEELSATATSLSEKAVHLEGLVAGFELGTGRKARPATARDIVPTKRGTPTAMPVPRRKKTATVDSGVQRSLLPPKAANGFEEF